MRKWTLALASMAIAIAGGVGVATATGGSRLDDGKQYLSQAKISEQQAVAAAQQAASGGLNEVDLEHYNGRLAWNVDVGPNDVKVDAATGQVLDAGHGD